MLANTQSIRCAFCLTCQKTGRRASTLRIVRYCLNIHYQFVTIAAKCKNPSFENVLCFKRERAVSRAPQACRSIQRSKERRQWNESEASRTQGRFRPRQAGRRRSGRSAPQNARRQNRTARSAPHRVYRGVLLLRGRDAGERGRRGICLVSGPPVRHGRRHARPLCAEDGGKLHRICSGPGRRRLDGIRCFYRRKRPRLDAAGAVPPNAAGRCRQCGGPQFLEPALRHQPGAHPRRGRQRADGPPPVRQPPGRVHAGTKTSPATAPRAFPANSKRFHAPS